MLNRKISLVLIVLLIFILSSCNKGSGNSHLLDNTTALFEIYLVKGMKTSDALNKGIDELPLEENPTLVNSEIKEYDWVNHQITLYDSTLEPELKGKVPVDGLPFVVVADKQRIYLGAFWTPISSLMVPKIPIIMSAGVDEDKKTYKIELLNPNAKDVRNDKRIRKALERSAILK